ncbi:Putative integral membrane protein (modular protein) [Nostocoides japonicum T1-X7]|uniref:Putative integral membrane protein (Modular protein) n=1 Tax=Nostocoides japonicum T1-X7 TaxID=1194083 RepID=A0A077M746_9MICO|nr:hypothetical protein [Tetrasphaera japonica]CCH79979.1 Putative integral membrane protein (modular protein) [Tetrasphaera japonica T1-X7]
MSEEQPRWTAPTGAPQQDRDPNGADGSGPVGGGSAQPRPQDGRGRASEGHGAAYPGQGTAPGGGGLAHGGQGPVHGGQGPAYGGPTQPLYAEYRPGIVPIRPLTLGDMFSGATLAIRGNPAATLGLGLVTTLVVVAPATALGVILTRVLVDQARVDDATGQDALDGFGAFGSLLPSLAAQLAVLLMTAFTAHVIGQGVLGRKTSLQETWEATRSRLWTVVGSAALVFLMIVVALLVLVGVPVAVLVYGIVEDVRGTVALGVGLTILGALAAIAVLLFIGTRFAFASAVIVLEHLGVRRGLGRSWRLTSGGQFWRVLGIRILVALLVGIVSGILTVPIGMALGLAVGAAGLSAATYAVVTVVVQALSTVITGALTTPFSAGTDTLLYLDQRIRREALDVQLLASVHGGR